MAATNLDDLIEIELPRLTDYQREHLFHPARTVVIEASTKSGKTLGCIIWQGREVLNDTRHRDHWWVAPIYGQAQIAYRRVKRMLPPELFDSNDTDHRITFISGARWWFKSAEKPDNLYGEDVASIVIDEASRMREEAYHALRTTITATGGAMRIIGNVKGRRNWAWRMARRAEAGDDDMHYARITAHDAIDAGLFSEDELRAAEGDLPEHIFRELYFAEASDDEGNPFGIDAIRACIGPLSRKPGLDWGGDLAKSVDWSVLIGLDEIGAVAKVLRFQKPWGETTRIFGETIGHDRAFIDSTGVGDPVVETLQKTARNITGYKFTGPSKQQLMEGLSVAIQRRQITYPDGVIVAELEAFEYIYSRTGVRYCVAEDSMILTNDLQWRKAAEIKVGDALLAFDERTLPGFKSRNWRPTTVTHADRISRPTYRIHMEDGAKLVASKEHRWLVKIGNTWEWRRTDQLRQPHTRSKSLRHAPSRLMRLLDVWDQGRSYDAGYLAAAFDGEGCISQDKKAHWGHSARLTFAQHENAMADHVRACLRTLGFEWAEIVSNQSGVISFGIVGRRPEVLRFLGQVRPRRLLDKLDTAKLGTLTQKECITIKSIEYLGEAEVVALGTTSGTIVVDGFASHNSAPEGLHDDAVMALALAIACRNARKAPWAPVAMPEEKEREMPKDGFIQLGPN